MSIENTMYKDIKGKDIYVGSILFDEELICYWKIIKVFNMFFAKLDSNSGYPMDIDFTIPIQEACRFEVINNYE